MPQWRAVPGARPARANKARRSSHCAYYARPRGAGAASASDGQVVDAAQAASCSHGRARRGLPSATASVSLFWLFRGACALRGCSSCVCCVLDQAHNSSAHTRAGRSLPNICGSHCEEHQAACRSLSASLSHVRVFPNRQQRRPQPATTSAGFQGTARLQPALAKHPAAKLDTSTTKPMTPFSCWRLVARRAVRAAMQVAGLQAAPFQGVHQVTARMGKHANSAHFSMIAKQSW